MFGVRLMCVSYYYIVRDLRVGCVHVVCMVYE